jgi:hypothetical protein
MEILARWRSLVLSALLLVPFPAYPQTTLTGAVQFSTDSSGAYSLGQIWNTLAGDHYWNLWLAMNPNATSPVNGPSDAQAGISIPLRAGSSYKYYIFGQPLTGFSFNGLNLFFDGNNSTPRISVFGAINTPNFLPNSSSTLTLQGTSMAGSGRSFYSSGGVTVVLTGYEWNVPATPPGDVCQAYVFAPGSGPDFFGSFTLQIFPSASLSLSQSSGSPGTKLTVSGSGFAPAETVNIYVHGTGFPPLHTMTDAGGSFTITAREGQAPYGPMDIYAVGQSSGKLGAAALFVTPGLIMNPMTGVPGGTTNVEGLGFGAGESVAMYWNNPRQLLGSATANSRGSLLGSSALTITIPTNASPGINGVIGFGQTTKAIGIAEITVQ